MVRLCSITVVPPLEGKFEELANALIDLPVELVPFEAITKTPLPLSTGDTLQELATRRAQAGVRLCSTLTVAESYGLEVDALGGRPGVHSMTFAHEHATDAENNAALLRALDEQAERPRGARLCSIFALVSPWEDTVYLARGICEGDIARTPAGSGYGYASLFAVRELGGQRMAELTEAERALVSPRRRAAQELGAILSRVLLRQLNDMQALFSTTE